MRIAEWRTALNLRRKCVTVRHSPCSEPLPEPSAARTLEGCKSETLPFFAYAIVTHGTMSVVLAPALVTRVEHVGGDFQRRSHDAFLLNELRGQVVGLLELRRCRDDRVREIEAAALAEPRQPLERPVKDAGTFGLHVFLHVGVALSLEGREFHDLDAPKDARRGVRNPRCLVHRPDDLGGWRDLLGVTVLAVHDDSLAGDQGVDDVRRAKV